MRSIAQIMGMPVTAEIADQLVDGAIAEAGGRSMGELASRRDAMLVALLAALEHTRKETKE